MFVLNSSEHGIYPAHKIVGISIFICRINTTTESVIARKVHIFHHLSLVVNSTR